MTTEVTSTMQQETFSVPENIDTVVTYIKEMQQRYAELISEKFNIPLEDTLKFKEENVELFVKKYSHIASSTVKTLKNKTKKTPKSEKITIENWQTAVCLSDLKSLKVQSLKDILSEKGLSITGSKSALMVRVWQINHPEYKDTTTDKKVSKKKTKNKNNKGIKDDTSSNIVEDSDNEDKSSEDISDLLDNHSKTVYFNDETKSISDTQTEGTIECILVTKKNWVFKNSEDTLEYMGIYNGELVVEGNPPSEILATMSSE